MPRRRWSIGPVLALVMAAAVAEEGWLRAGGEVQTGGPRGTGLLMGVVVDSTGGAPVASVRVTLGAGGGVPDLVVLTDSDGRFVFLDLPTGTYTVTATRAGYAEGALGRRRPEGPGQAVTLRDAERIGDLRIPIWRLAAITGTVRDEAGEPMVAVPVRALRRTIVAGRRTFVPDAIDRTDDRGTYRLRSLVPGDYVVAVPSTQAVAPESVVDLYRDRTGPSPPGTPDILRDLSFSGGADVPNLVARTGAPSADGLAFLSVSGTMRAAGPVVRAGRVFVYPTEFHLAARVPAQATSVALGPGDERPGVDVNLKLVPAVRVTGTVTGPSGPLVTVMTLTPDMDEFPTDASMETATTLSDAAGRFTFMGVPPGQYRLRAIRVEVPAGGSTSRGGAPPPPRAPAGQTATPALPGYTLSATQSITVGATDLQDVAVTVRPGFRVSGQAQFTNATSPVAPALVRRMTVIFDPVDARPVVGPIVGRGHFDENGRLWSYQMPPGRYYLRLDGAPPGWTPKHAIWNGRDVSNVPFTLDRDVGGVSIELTDRPSTLSGQVQDASGAPDPAATVLIFPADSGGWTDHGAFPRRLRAVRADRDGGYQTAGLPPGDYLVVAVVDESTTSWRDPAALETLARVASAVTLGEDERRSLGLRTVAVSR